MWWLTTSSSRTFCRRQCRRYLPLLYLLWPSPNCATKRQTRASAKHNFQFARCPVPSVVTLAGYAPYLSLMPVKSLMFMFLFIFVGILFCFISRNYFETVYLRIMFFFCRILGVSCAFCKKFLPLAAWHSFLAKFCNA